SRIVDTVAFPAYTREIVDRVGPYDVELVRNQDDEYNYRLRKMGGRLLLAADVRCTYFSRSSLKKLWRQDFQYGYWRVRVRKKHPRQMSVRQFAPLAFVVALLAGMLASPWSVGRLALALMLAAYALANVAATALATRRGKAARGVFYVPIAFVILHLSYGSGFLVGLF